MCVCVCVRVCVCVCVYIICFCVFSTLNWNSLKTQRLENKN